MPAKSKVISLVVKAFAGKNFPNSVDAVKRFFTTLGYFKRSSDVPERLASRVLNRIQATVPEVARATEVGRETIARTARGLLDKSSGMLKKGGVLGRHDVEGLISDFFGVSTTREAARGAALAARATGRGITSTRGLAVTGPAALFGSRLRTSQKTVEDIETARSMLPSARDELEQRLIEELTLRHTASDLQGTPSLSAETLQALLGSNTPQGIPSLVIPPSKGFPITRR